MEPEHDAPEGLAVPQHPSPEVVLVSVGDIACTRDSILLPSGRRPLAGSQWTVNNNTVTTESIPVWAIIAAIVFVWFCLIGLLFLLVKSRRTTGYVQVAVHGPGFHHATYMQVTDVSQVAEVDRRVTYIRDLVAAQSAPQQPPLGGYPAPPS